MSTQSLNDTQARDLVVEAIRHIIPDAGIRRPRR